MPTNAPNAVVPASGLLSIGEVAATTGLAVSAIRYYDEIGLIEAATRVGGKRRFTPDTVGRVSFVQRTQAAGFSLEEINAILDDTVGGWRAHVDAKLEEVIQQRQQLDTVIEVLREIRRCGCRAAAECPRAEASD